MHSMGFVMQNYKIYGGVGYMKKKQQNITFRVTEYELKMLKENAMNLNLTMTDFIVKCCQEKDVEINKRK